MTPKHWRSTKDQFMERYGRDAFNDSKIALPCDCADGGGPTHWAAVSNNVEAINEHLELYAPEGTEWPVEAIKARLEFCEHQLTCAIGILSAVQHDHGLDLSDVIEELRAVRGETGEKSKGTTPASTRCHEQD